MDFISPHKLHLYMQCRLFLTPAFLSKQKRFPNPACPVNGVLSAQTHSTIHVNVFSNHATNVPNLYIVFAIQSYSICFNWTTERALLAFRSCPNKSFANPMLLEPGKKPWHLEYQEGPSTWTHWTPCFQLLEWWYHYQTFFPVRF